MWITWCFTCSWVGAGCQSLVFMLAWCQLDSTKLIWEDATSPEKWFSSDWPLAMHEEVFLSSDWWWRAQPIGHDVTPGWMILGIGKTFKQMMKSKASKLHSSMFSSVFDFKFLLLLLPFSSSSDRLWSGTWKPSKPFPLQLALGHCVCHCGRTTTRACASLSPSNYFPSSLFIVLFKYPLMFHVRVQNTSLYFFSALC